MDMGGLFQLNDVLAERDILWSMHTTMNLDRRYQAALMAMQHCGSKYPAAKEYREALKAENFEEYAFFYNAETPVTCKKSVSSKIPIKNTQAFSYPVRAGGVTFHAKITLLCFKNAESGDCSYGMIVYSKNTAYAPQSQNEVAVPLDIIWDGDAGPEGNGQELQAFLKKLYASTNNAGKRWLKDHELHAEGALYKKFERACFKISGTDTGAKLYFGGCGVQRDQKERKLIDILRLDQCTKDSVVLTPPAFIQTEKAQNYFEKEFPVLYDIDNRDADPEHKKSSHAKLYLLEYPDGSCKLFLGSANATPRGIGLCGSTIPNSIECLAGVDITKELFDDLKKGITDEGYRPYTDFSTDGSFQHKEDKWGQYLSLYGCVKDVRYYDEAHLLDERTLNAQTDLAKIEYDIAFTEDSAVSNIRNLSNEEITGFFPAEYKQEGFGFEWRSAQVLTLIYKKACKGSKPQTFKFLPAQGVLLMGQSRAVLAFEPPYLLPAADGIPRTRGPVLDILLDKMASGEDAGAYLRLLEQSSGYDTKQIETLQSIAEKLQQPV